MKNKFDIKINTATKKELYEHLISCDKYFIPPLSKIVDINKYVQKISENTVRFEVWSGNILVGCLAAYINDLTNRFAFITNVSVVKSFWRQGVATILLTACLDYSRDSKFNQISLEVNKHNVSAIHLYESFNFVHHKNINTTLIMTRMINNKNEQKKKL